MRAFTRFSIANVLLSAIVAGCGGGGESPPPPPPPPQQPPALSLETTRVEPLDTVRARVEHAKAGAKYELEFGLGGRATYRTRLVLDADGGFTFAAPTGTFSPTEGIVDGTVQLRLNETSNGSMQRVAEASLEIQFNPPSSLAQMPLGEPTKQWALLQLALLQDASTKLARIEGAGVQVLAQRSRFSELNDLAAFYVQLYIEITRVQQGGSAVTLPLKSPQGTTITLSGESLALMDRQSARLLSALLGADASNVRLRAANPTALAATARSALKSLPVAVALVAEADGELIDIRAFTSAITDRIRDTMPKIGAAVGVTIAAAAAVVGAPAEIPAAILTATAFAAFTYVPAAITLAIDGFAAAATKGQATFDDVKPSLNYIVEQIKDAIIDQAVSKVLGEAAEELCGRACEFLGSNALTLVDLLPESVQKAETAYTRQELPEMGYGDSPIGSLQLAVVANRTLPGLDVELRLADDVGKPLSTTPQEIALTVIDPNRQVLSRHSATAQGPVDRFSIALSHEELCADSIRLYAYVVEGSAATLSQTLSFKELCNNRPDDPGAMIPKAFIEWSLNGQPVARLEPEDVRLDSQGLSVGATKNALEAIELDLSDPPHYGGHTALTDTRCLDPEDFHYRAHVFVNNAPFNALNASGGLPPAPYSLNTCAYNAKHTAASAGEVSLTLETIPIDDDPKTASTENALQLVRGSFDFFVSDLDLRSAQRGGFEFGDQHVTGSFLVIAGTCEELHGCRIH